MSQPAVSPICPSIPRQSLLQPQRPQAPLPPHPDRSQQQHPPSRLLRSRQSPRPHQARTCLRSQRQTASSTLPTIQSRSNSLDPKLPSYPLWLHHPSPPLPSPPPRLFLLSLHRLPPLRKLHQLQPSKSRTKLSTRRYIVRVLVRSLLSKPRCTLVARTARHIPSAVRMARQVLLLLFLNTLVISTHLASTLLANSSLQQCNLKAVLSTLNSNNISNTSDPIPDKTHSIISHNRLTLQDPRMAHPWLRLNTMATTPAPPMGMRTVMVMVRVEIRL
jgi:hypothetical protein